MDRNSSIRKYLRDQAEDIGDYIEAVWNLKVDVVAKAYYLDDNKHEKELEGSYLGREE